MQTMQTINTEEVLSEGLQRISQAAAFLGTSKPFIYQLMRAKELPWVQCGRTRRVPIRAVKDWAINHIKLGGGIE